MVRRDLARERLQEIRKLQGWRSAEKAAGLSPGTQSQYKSKAAWEGTRRRRLSRLINKKSSGSSFKKLDAKQRRKINRTYKTKTRQKAFAGERAELEIKAINRLRGEARKRAKATFGKGGTFPDSKKLANRLKKHKNLNADEMERIKNAFKNIEKDGGAKVRAEYKSFLASVKVTELPTRQRFNHSRRLDKAIKAVKRDEQNAQRKLEDF